MALLAVSGCATQKTAVERLPATDASSSELVHDMAAHDMVAHDMTSMNGSAAPVACKAWTDRVTPEQQEVINAVIGARFHRLHHAFWHATRGGLEPSEMTRMVNAFGGTWTEVHPLCPQPQADSAAPGYNPVGEDFLFMHRQMIEMLRAGFVSLGLPCVTGWQHVPATEEWPLPDDSREGAKSAEALQQFQGWDGAFQNVAWLKSVSLSQLGWALEFSLHNNLHMRYATDQPPTGFNGVTETGGAPLPYDGKYPVDWIYDDPHYNWLADPYGAAVNPVFWKIHGYVDHLIDLWLGAHGYDSISTQCNGSAHCYTWKGTWIGNISQEKLPALPSAGNPRDSRPSADTVRFTQRRMKHQRLGVLTPADVGRKRAQRPGDGPAVIDDPLPFVNAKLCTSPSQSQ